MLENKKIDLFLAALDPYISKNTVDNTEKTINGKDFISWGENNAYPQFLLDCYNNCSTLQSIINGTGDFIVGNNVICNVNDFKDTINKNGDTMVDLLNKLANDYLIFGAFAIQIVRNMAGQVAELYWMDINKVRTDKKNEVFFYSEDWAKSYGRVKYITYPKFKPNDDNATSVFYYKNPMSRTIYGQPLWNASVKNVMIDRAITDFQNNEIHNNFMGSKMISFNNGIPDDALKSEIERNLNEKFAGAANAGRFLISFAESKTNAPVVVDLGTNDFASRYVELEKRNTNQLFVAFRAQPILFGLLKENNGFSQDEYLQAFALYNRTVVKPIQIKLIDAFDKILGVKDSLAITPFSIEVVDDTLTDNDNVA